MSSFQPLTKPMNQKEDLGSNRRVFVRYPCGKTTAAHMAMEESCIFHPVRVLDISAGGVALLLWEAMEKGADVFVQLTNRDQDLTLELPAKVAHVCQLPTGKWAIGFSFVQPLTPEELAQLV
jgi:hypothetical protein